MLDLAPQLPRMVLLLDVLGDVSRIICSLWGPRAVPRGLCSCFGGFSVCLFFVCVFLLLFFSPVFSFFFFLSLICV